MSSVAVRGVRDPRLASCGPHNLADELLRSKMGVKAFTDQKGSIARSRVTASRSAILANSSLATYSCTANCVAAVARPTVSQPSLSLLGVLCNFRHCTATWRRAARAGDASQPTIPNAQWRWSVWYIQTDRSWLVDSILWLDTFCAHFERWKRRERGGCARSPDGHERSRPSACIEAST